MVWRYGLAVDPDRLVSFVQIDRLIASAVMACERFYPAIQLTLWDDKSPAEAIKIAMSEAYGRA